MSEAKRTDKKSYELQTICYIEPSFGWSVRERAVLGDALIAKEFGHKIVIYCSRDSILDEQAKKYKLKRIFLPKVNKLRLYDWHRLSIIKRTLNENHVTIVHTYEADYLRGLSTILGKNDLTPLVFTSLEAGTDKKRGPLTRYLLGRIDSVLTTTPEVASDLYSVFGIPLRKSHQCVPGYFPKHIEQTIFRNAFLQRWQLPDDTYLVGLAVPQDVNSLNEIECLINAMRGIVYSKQNSKRIACILFSEKPWEQSVIYRELQQRLSTDQLLEYMFFSDVISIHNILWDLDIWLELEFNPGLEDYALVAMEEGTPVLMPRNAQSMHFISEFRDSALTYMANDARDLRTQIITMTNSLEKFSKNLQLNKDKFDNLYGRQNYREFLLYHYERIRKRRKRLLNRSSKRIR